MSFLSDISQYTEPKYQLIGDSINPTDPSGNAALYAGHFVLIAKHQGLPDDGGEAYLRHVYEVLKVEPGLINRKPGASDPQAHDDYVGLALSKVVAEEIYQRGQRTHHNYNNLAPTANSMLDIINQKMRYFHARMPGQVQHYALCSGRPVGLLGRAWWAVGIVGVSLFSSGASDMLLAYLKLQRAPEGVFGRMAKAAFLWRLKRSFGGEVSSLYATYFGPTHPFAIYSKGMKLG